VDYEIIPEDEQTLYKQQTSTIVNAVKRRETKIKQYQKEKELRARIDARLIYLEFLKSNNHWILLDPPKAPTPIFHSVYQYGLRPHIFPSPFFTYSNLHHVYVYVFVHTAQ